MRVSDSLFGTRGRLFVLFIKRLLITILANAGQRLAPAYQALSRHFAESEQQWINRRGIGDTDYYQLMSLYPERQRVLFIHIPKAGGTSIRRMLVRESKCAPIPTPGEGTVSQAIHYMHWSAPRKSMQRRFLNACAAERDAESLRQRFLRVFAGYCVAQSPQRMFILGHKTAGEMLPYYREGRDLFFATVRAPAEILKSLVAYRVMHTLDDKFRPDSIELLDSLQLDIHTFTELVRDQPRQLTELILAQQPPILTTFLAFNHQTDHESVWQGIKQRCVFLAHMSEQDQMLARLLGSEPSQRRENTSADRVGLAAEFTASIKGNWIEPFVHPDSTMLYQRLEAVGIIGFWEGGGTVRQYRELLNNS